MIIFKKDQIELTCTIKSIISFCFQKTHQTMVEFLLIKQHPLKNNTYYLSEEVFWHILIEKNESNIKIYDEGFVKLVKYLTWDMNTFPIEITGSLQ